jgi:hypothetical protein
MVILKDSKFFALTAIVEDELTGVYAPTKKGHV